MIREFVGHLHWSTLPVVSMFLFMSVFFGALIWVYRKESQSVYSKMSELPLIEEGELR